MLTRPTVVFSPTMPHKLAGMRTEPPVSLPIAAGARPAATATPEPLLDPPGARCRCGSHGFHGVPVVAFVPQLPKANSTIWVLPRVIMPAAVSRCTTVEVTGDTRSVSYTHLRAHETVLDLVC